MRADRLVTMILLLQTRKKLTARALATRLEVSPRTILRDVEALSRAGIPMYTTGGRGGGIALDENYRVTLTRLKNAEIQTLLLASHIQLLKGIWLGNAARNALLNISAPLPPHDHP